VTRTPHSPDWRPRFALLALIWGSSFLSIKVAVDVLAPVDVAFGRVSLGALVLLIALAARRQRLPRGRAVWGHLFVIALFGNSIPFLLLAEGETRISSVLAGIWNATTPLLTLVVATFMLPDERPTPRRVAGLLAGFGGVLVVLGPWRSVGGGELLGQLMCLGAAACYGIGFPYTRRFLTGRPESAVSLSAAQVLCGTLQLAPFAAIATGAPRRFPLDAVLSLLALGATLGLAVVPWQWSLRRLGAALPFATAAGRPSVG
jgi:drug/metabolite transporter (DMT)-like permease